MTLDKLMTRLSEGDKSAFEKIYSLTSKTVYYVALSVVRERALAEDVMQSTYLNVLKFARQYRKGSNAKAWIARITRNEALNLRRSNVREEYVDETENAELFGTEQTDDYGLLIDMARKLLTTDELAVLLMAMSEGYKRREIAEILDMPVSTVTWKYNKAIEKMREALKDR